MQQTTLPLVNYNNNIWNDFIESSSNKLACQYINDWPNKFGILPYSKILLIKGSKSSGKTSLANIWAKKTNALFIKKNHKITANILDHHQAFIIDGLDASWREEEVLHHFNLLHEHGKYLLITINGVLDIKLPDLSSRLNSVNKVDILMPDDELVRILIFKQFSDFSITVNEEVINYLLKVLPREVPQILLSIKRINQISLEQKRKITIPFIKQIL